MQETHLKQIKTENEFYIHQVTDLERNLVLARDTTKTVHNKVSKVNLTELSQKQKQLEEELQHEMITRDVFANKIKKIQQDIDKLEDTIKPVLLKKLRMLEQELIQVKGEKDILIKQIDSASKQTLDEVDVQNKQVEKLNSKIATIKQKNRIFERRLAKLTHRDASLSPEERIPRMLHC